MCCCLRKIVKIMVKIRIIIVVVVVVVSIICGQMKQQKHKNNRRRRITRGSCHSGSSSRSITNGRSSLQTFVFWPRLPFLSFPTSPRVISRSCLSFLLSTSSRSLLGTLKSQEPFSFESRKTYIKTVQSIYSKTKQYKNNRYKSALNFVYISFITAILRYENNKVFRVYIQQKHIYEDDNSLITVLYWYNQNYLNSLQLLPHNYLVGLALYSTLNV